MNKKELIALSLTEEQANKVLEVKKPYARFKKVNYDKNELKIKE